MDCGVVCLGSHTGEDQGVDYETHYVVPHCPFAVGRCGLGNGGELLPGRLLRKGLLQ
jgi:hypothetical protein